MSSPNENKADVDAIPLTDEEIMVNAGMEVLRGSFRRGETKTRKWRLQQLRNFQRMVTEGKDELMAAMQLDLHKPDFESYFFEVNLVEAEVAGAIDHLDEWMRPKNVGTDLMNTLGLGQSYVKRDPLGVVCIIGAWNYPVLLTLQPFVGCIAAGNCAMIKLPSSNYSSNTARAIRMLVEKYMDKRYFKVYEGDRKVTAAVLKCKFDLMFFTGGSFVGRMVHEAAAKNLCPVILELGGKSPCVVDSSADLYVTALRVVQGKWSNAGQTCICPDYVMVHASVADKFLEEVKKVLRKFFGDDARESADYGRIINKRAHARLRGLLDDSKEYIVHGGDSKASDLYVEPTLIDFGEDMKAFAAANVMKDEIFGPLLPIFRWTDEDDIFRFVQDREKPLAMYMFGSNKRLFRRIRDELTAGSFCVNECLFQMCNHRLPFGGVGKSGMGRYHGKFSFDAFSHLKAVLYKQTWPDFALRPFRYPAAGRSATMKKIVFWATYIVQYPRYIVPRWLRGPLRWMMMALVVNWLLSSFSSLRSVVRGILLALLNYVGE